MRLGLFSEGQLVTLLEGETLMGRAATEAVALRLNVGIDQFALATPGTGAEYLTTLWAIRSAEPVSWARGATGRGISCEPLTGQLLFEFAEAEPELLVPNPYGKIGGPAHQVKVGQVLRDIKLRGLQAEREVSIETVAGEKPMRVIDVIARDPNTGQIVEVHQIGRTLRSYPMVPVARERAALRDVRHSPVLWGAKRIFHGLEPPY